MQLLAHNGVLSAASQGSQSSEHRSRFSRRSPSSIQPDEPRVLHVPETRHNSQPLCGVWRGAAPWCCRNWGYPYPPIREHPYSSESPFGQERARRCCCWPLQYIAVAQEREIRHGQCSSCSAWLKTAVLCLSAFLDDGISCLARDS